MKANMMTDVHVETIAMALVIWTKRSVCWKPMVVDV